MVLQWNFCVVILISDDLSNTVLVFLLLPTFIWARYLYANMETCIYIFFLLYAFCLYLCIQEKMFNDAARKCYSSLFTLLNFIVESNTFPTFSLFFLLVCSNKMKLLQMSESLSNDDYTFPLYAIFATLDPIHIFILAVNALLDFYTIFGYALDVSQEDR